ncbi:MAG: GlmU family protein [Candidatus Marinimicrobia bacterium]|nr:GlmU family protein [Candidatus Neomarinimicrobiota bacterium]MDP6611225.1 GlmU family protein [Candidatus Neomarinimicrobiota bacterium]
MHIVLFEDQAYQNLLPLVYYRPVYDLRCGITSIKDKIIRNFPKSTITLHARNYLANCLTRDHPSDFINKIPPGIDKVLFINGRCLTDLPADKILKYPGKDSAFVNGKTVVGAWLSRKNLDSLKKVIKERVLDYSDFANLEQEEVETKLINYPWDPVSNNGEQLITDFKFLTNENPEQLGDIHQDVTLLNPAQIHISEGAKLAPGVVIDADGGPVYIDKNVKILPNAVIEGPAFIGRDSLIKIGAKIYENTSIGEVCKVGGEVEESIIHAYSNKQHEGFLGRAYLGMWVNIGADTNNSDLKNDYGNVKVYVNGELIDSGSISVGLTMGDHSKTGINGMFNTGSNIGVSCNLYGSGFQPKYVPSFSWGGTDEGLSTYRIDKAIEVARRVMTRRKIEFTAVDEELFKSVFELSAPMRKKAGIKN